MKKQTQVTARTRQNIMDAFWEIYTTKRIEKITVKEITAKAGYNRSTFYKYFTDVYHVLDEIEDALIPDVDELPAFTTSFKSGGIPLEHFISLYQKNSKYYMVLLGEKGDPAFSTRLKNQIKASLLLFFESQNKNFRELDYTLEYILSAMVGIMSYWFSQKQSITKECLVELIQNLTKHGVMDYVNLLLENNTN